MLLDMQKYFFSKSLFDTIYIEIKQMLEIYFGQESDTKNAVFRELQLITI